MNDEQAFWQTTPLDKMSKDEWESICDGCGKCCLHKLEDDDTGEVSYTNVACRLLDNETIKCKNYKERKRFVPDCMHLTPKKLKTITWLPSSCAYLLLEQGKPLPNWHHLVAGSKEAIHKANASIKGRIVSEHMAGDLQDHVVEDGEF